MPVGGGHFLGSYDNKQQERCQRHRSAALPLTFRAEGPSLDVQSGQAVSKGDKGAFGAFVWNISFPPPRPLIGSHFLRNALVDNGGFAAFGGVSLLPR